MKMSDKESVNVSGLLLVVYGEGGKVGHGDFRWLIMINPKVASTSQSAAASISLGLDITGQELIAFSHHVE